MTDTTNSSRLMVLESPSCLLTLTLPSIVSVAFSIFSLSEVDDLLALLRKWVSWTTRGVKRRVTHPVGCRFVAVASRTAPRGIRTFRPRSVLPQHEGKSMSSKMRMIASVARPSVSERFATSSGSWAIPIRPSFAGDRKVWLTLSIGPLRVRHSTKFCRNRTDTRIGKQVTSLAVGKDDEVVDIMRRVPMLFLVFDIL